MCSQIFFLCYSLIVYLSSAFGESRNPGIITKITQKGLDFLSDYSKDELRLFLGSGNKYSFGGDIGRGFRLELDNIRIRKFSPSLRSRIYLRPNAGLEWRMTEITTDIDADFKSRINVASTSRGILKLKLYRMGAILKMSVDERNRRLATRVTDCQVYIGLVDLKSSKGSLVSRLVSFKRNLTPRAKRFFQDNFCKIIEKHLANHVAEKMFNMPRAAHLFDNYYINYEPVSQPKFGQNSVQIHHHGECFALARSRLRQTVTLNSTAFRYNPPRLEASTVDSEKMNYYYMTEYHLKTMVYWMHRFSRFNYKFDKEEVGSDFADYLKMDCGEDDLCAGSLFPTLAERFPKSYAEVFVKGLRSPEVRIVDGKINATTVGQIDGYARRPSGQLTEFISGKIRLFWSFHKMTLKNGTLNGKLDFVSYNLFDVETDVEEFDRPSLEFLVDVTLETTVKPDISGVLKDGIKLPRLVDFQPIDEEVRMQPGVLVASNNFCRGVACLRNTKQPMGAGGKAMTSSESDGDVPDYIYDFTT